MTAAADIAAPTAEMTVAATASVAPPVELIAGLDVTAASELAAEHVLEQAIRCLRQAGADPITAATHRATVYETPHVSMSISMSTGLDPVRMVDMLAEALSVADGAAGAVRIGEVGVGAPELQASAERAAAAHRDRSSGRVVHFPGSETLTGTVLVADVLATLIDRVVALGGGHAAPDSPLVTRSFLRPRWDAGELVLHVQQAVGDTWVPFETPNPTPCCAVHTAVPSTA